MSKGKRVCRLRKYINMNVNEQTVKNWILKYVLKLNLCPFAHTVMENESYAFFTGQISDAISLINQSITAIGKPDVVTTFMIIKNELPLDVALDLYANVEHVLDKMKLLEQLKPILFHPDYLHDGLESNSPIHYSNRAPKTIIQFLAHDELDRLNAKVLSPKILADNERTLTNLGVVKLQKMLSKLSEDH